MTEPAAWFTLIMAGMQSASAEPASAPPCLCGKIPITCEEKIVEGGIRQQGCIHNHVILRVPQLLTNMAKPGRNDPCHCGSGKKYKKCCLPKDEAKAAVALADEQAERVTAQRPDVHSLTNALAERLAQTWHAHGDDEIAVASHVVVELVQAGKLADADAAARDLMMRYPHEPDGWDCLGIVHEARGENRQAADCYRKMRDIMRQRPHDYDQSFETEFAALIDKLDPPVAGQM
jgi:hypothetical protein